MKKLGLVVLILGITFLLLAIPDVRDDAPTANEMSPFTWSDDALWTNLENSFKQARRTGCEVESEVIASKYTTLSGLLSSINTISLAPKSPEWLDVENQIFDLASRIAACPDTADLFASTYSRVRKLVKAQSENWDMQSQDAKNVIYRLLYGTRTAMEEVIVQSGDKSLANLVVGTGASATPSAVIDGITVHSGDVVISRGGAPTSALIARGSDYPGNFSHAAMVHVSDDGEISTIEAHIEVGVAINTLQGYFDEKNMRLMLLRPRRNLWQIEADPMLPHKAAAYALNRAKTEYIPYDFSMDYKDPSKLFCSEVASNAYEQFGIEMWEDMSTISGPGIRNWLYDFGVRHFETEEPSDLEYDPQFYVIAEWRDFDRLVKDRIDNAVVDVMLEQADEGTRLQYAWYELPVGRVLKVYSMIQKLFGKHGLVPDGMSASAALWNLSYTKQQEALAEKTTALANAFEAKEGYAPPYWRLVDLARQVIDTDN